MNHYLDSKAIAVGFTISLITALLSLSLAPIFFLENEPLGSYSRWDLESPENLALSMDQSLPNLIYVSIWTGVVTTAFIEDIQSWSVNSEPFFLSRIASFQYLPILDNNLTGTSFAPDNPVFKTSNWELDYSDCCPSEDKSIILTNTRDFQEKLQNGLNADINRFADLTNITFSIDEQTKNAEMQEDVFYWEIILVFNDGTKIEIRAYGNVVIISQIPVLEILVDDGDFALKIDLDQTPFPSYYTVTLNNPFEIYENVINEVLNTIIGNNG